MARDSEDNAGARTSVEAVSRWIYTHVLALSFGDSERTLGAVSASPFCLTTAGGQASLLEGKDCLCLS